MSPSNNVLSTPAVLKCRGKVDQKWITEYGETGSMYEEMDWKRRYQDVTLGSQAT